MGISCKIYVFGTFFTKQVKFKKRPQLRRLFSSGFAQNGESIFAARFWQNDIISSKATVAHAVLHKFHQKQRICMFLRKQANVGKLVQLVFYTSLSSKRVNSCWIGIVCTCLTK